MKVYIVIAEQILMVTMVIAEQDHQPILSSYMMSFSSQAEKQRFSSFAPLSADSATTIHGASAKTVFTCTKH